MPPQLVSPQASLIMTDISCGRMPPQNCSKETESKSHDDKTDEIRPSQCIRKPGSRWVMIVSQWILIGFCGILSQLRQIDNPRKMDILVNPTSSGSCSASSGSCSASSGSCSASSGSCSASSGSRTASSDSCSTSPESCPSVPFKASGWWSIRIY